MTWGLAGREDGEGCMVATLREGHGWNTDQRRKKEEPGNDFHPCLFRVSSVAISSDFPRRAFSFPDRTYRRRRGSFQAYRFVPGRLWRGSCLGNPWQAGGNTPEPYLRFPSSLRSRPLWEYL